ncbi:inner centromere protein A-like isoform X2 [Homarus americanus]|uniref:inner centromere protein A-like isoform X2 n=1 Tax=Homarus americanus TaxID=6706 RepID=UPI001C438648|nr:inner centromere protein A-like isoform X2 [Homarus americanus]
MEEQPEKESVASEKLGLCLFLTESEDEKDGKSSQVVQKSPLVRSVPSVTSMKPSQSATSYTSENTVMAASSTQNTEIGPVRRIIDLSSKTGCTVRELATAYQNHIGETLNEVEELTSEECEVTHSPAHVTRHARVRHAKTPDSQRVRIKPPARTPPATCPSDKVIRPKKILLSSSSSTHGSSRDTPKTFSRSRLMLTSSSSKFGDPNEAKYPTNIVTGITSFIKIQPAKPSLEEKRQTGLQKKRDREDETIKKKEELLKLKAEGQKRRNEERMKRVQEAREERERKAIEAKKQQDRDRKNREERLREQQQQHRKQQLLAKRRAEEARVKKIKEQEEERRKQEEESRKLKEEEKQNEEEKLLYLAEQRRRQEEERKRKIAEVERIAREKKELEYLKLLEAQRIAELQQAKLTSSAVKKIALADNKETGLNHTFTLSDNKENGLNTTFSKTTGPSQSSSTGKNKDSYDITPNSKKYKKNINNYDINDIESDDSTDEDSAPKRKIPPWAMSKFKIWILIFSYCLGFYE